MRQKAACTFVFEVQAAIGLNLRFREPMCAPSYCFFVFQTAAKPFERLPETFKAACTHPLSRGKGLGRGHTRTGSGKFKDRAWRIAAIPTLKKQPAPEFAVRPQSPLPSPPPRGGSRLPKPRHWLHKPKKQPALSEFGSAGCFLNTQSITAGMAASDNRALRR